MRQRSGGLVYRDSTSIFRDGLQYLPVFLLILVDGKETTPVFYLTFRNKDDGVMCSRDRLLALFTMLAPSRAGRTLGQFSLAPEMRSFFFRPTPLGFRQVVQHVRLHVAEISELVN